MAMIRTMAGNSMACGVMAIYYDLPCRHVPMNFLMWLVLPFRFRPALFGHPCLFGLPVILEKTCPEI